jgi:hypothetical protein
MMRHATLIALAHYARLICSACGGSFEGGSHDITTPLPTALVSRADISLMTTGSSIQAMTLTAPPHSRHVSMSIRAYFFHFRE